FRARSLGEPPQLAAETGARRMVAPVLASTLTTVIAFGAMMVVGGRFGDMIADIPWVVMFVLMGSTIECFLILPNHMAHALRHAGRARWYDAPSRTVMRGFDWVVARLVRPLMGWVITARYVVLALMVLALVSQGALFLRGAVQFRFFNGPEQTTVTGNFALLPGATRDDATAMMRELQRAAEALAARYEAEYGSAPFTFVQAVVGGGSGRGLAGAETRDPDLLGGISIELIDRDLRPWSASTFVADLQDEVHPQPLLEELSFRGGHYGPGGNALSVDLYGAEAAVLKAAAEAVKTALARFPEVSGLEDTLAYDKQEMILNLTPQGRALGFASDALGRELRDRLNGIEAASLPDGPRSATIRVELPAGEL
ncbi:MAG: efflux RND transporter permease subunit, partial [Alphaproteobacteria bacterium]|nr:efflux RND transporter permease subunit [Alphaproteobacteria bacterium]